MHLNGVCDLLEVERPQMGDPVCEEGVLLAHDLAGNLENGPRALVQ